MDENRETIVEIDVPPGYAAGERLDQYLSEKLSGMSRTKVQQAIKAGQVGVGGTIQTRPSTLVQAGDRLTVHLLRPPPIEARPEAIPLDIVFEDDNLIVVNKPAGMVVHPAYGHHGGTLVNALLHHVGGGTVSFEDDESDPESEEVGLSTATAAPRFEGDVSVRPGIVHRLDKDTSGLLIVAKSDAAHADLARQFMQRTIRRRYLAIVWGVPDPADGTIESALARDPRDRRRVAVAASPRGKHAITHYAMLEPLGHTALVEFRLETGRTHQIRVHAAHIGHPLLGDVTYGGGRVRSGPATANRKKFFNNLFARMPRQALHAHTLGFIHPASGKEMHFEAPLPEDIAHVLERLRAVEGGGDDRSAA